MRDIAAVMITCDRSPQRNYLGETVDNLIRGRLSIGTSRLVTAPDVVAPLFLSSDGEQVGPDTLSICDDLKYTICLNWNPWECPNLNVANALRVGSGMGEPQWVLFLEDDIDVCADFFDSVGAWLDDHAREDRRIYSFGANYPQVQELYGQGIYAWDYPIEQFYGTQSFAIRPGDALSLAEYIREHCYDRSPDGTQWDLLMQDWSREKYPEIDHFLASCPAFVDHIGEESVVMPGRKGHTYPSWPGREWSYLKERQR